MTDTSDRLFNLLPVVYQRRDARKGYPLKALLRVVGEQVDLVEADIERLYDDWFIETCDDWVVPYIADLIGYRRVESAGLPGNPKDTTQQHRNRVLIPRREVAKTVRYRRRKGTLAVLEQLALDVARWPARAVEYRKLTAQTQAVNHLQLERGRTVDLRNGNTLDLINGRRIEDAGREGLEPAEVVHQRLIAHGAFDELSHTVDVRRIDSHRTPGRFNLSDVGLFVFRVKSYSVTESPAATQPFGSNYFTFSPLGNDKPLFVRPEAEQSPTSIAGEMNLPVPLRRRAFESDQPSTENQPKHASTAFYGADRSVAIWAEGWEGHDHGHDEQNDPIPASKIIPSNLSSWKYLPPPGYVAVDPVLGRMTFATGEFPRKGVRVSCHHGFSADIGGGEYRRRVSQPDSAIIYRVSANSRLKSIADAKRAWLSDKPKHAVIELSDNREYEEQIHFELPAQSSLQLRSASGCRPIVRLSKSAAWTTLTGDTESRFTLDGLLIVGLPVNVEGNLSQVVIRHCTLLPGSTIRHDCEPDRPDEPSLVLYRTTATLQIESSIVGSIQVRQDEVSTDPIVIQMTDSILDATGPNREAIGSDADLLAHAVLTIRRCTVLGYIDVHAIQLAENSIFTGRVKVGRRQTGCMRFCYIEPHVNGKCSRTPKRYRCQPELAVKQLEERVKNYLARQDGWDQLSQEERRNRIDDELSKLTALEEQRVRPVFNAVRYDLPTYCQLADSCAVEIKRGADDESEMGAFHNLYEPQRFSNLDRRLDEFTPANSDAGIIFAT